MSEPDTLSSTATALPLAPFCKLAHSSTYLACNWDLTVDAAGRRHWVAFFNRHFYTILAAAISAAINRGVPKAVIELRAGAAKQRLGEKLDRFENAPDKFGRVTILTLDTWRDEALRAEGLHDAFIDLKQRENALALPLLPKVCRQLDELNNDAARLLAIVEGVFAGNIFDMGAEATAKAFAESGPDFFATRRRLKPRPWLIDHYDALANRLHNGPTHRKAVFFIDNAGSDFLLGAVPMIRWMARRGTTVILAANERPTLNDMTIHDVRAWWPKILEAEPSLAGLPVQLVSTGTGEPLIDLAAVSDDLNQASADADLVILEGMGRGVESNLDARFNCDAVNLAMLKDIAVAARCGGGLYDVVCRFQPVAR